MVAYFMQCLQCCCSLLKERQCEFVFEESGGGFMDLAVLQYGSSPKHHQQLEQQLR